jgi:hypothetical protein
MAGEIWQFEFFILLLFGLARRRPLTGSSSAELLVGKKCVHCAHEMKNNK